jgi:hypothetical protein
VAVAVGITSVGFHLHPLGRLKLLQLVAVAQLLQFKAHQAMQAVLLHLVRGFQPMAAALGLEQTSIMDLAVVAAANLALVVLEH